MSAEDMIVLALSAVATYYVITHYVKTKQAV